MMKMRPIDEIHRLRRLLHQERKSNAALRGVITRMKNDQRRLHDLFNRMMEEAWREAKKGKA
jgi:hypothetical protein